MMLIRRISTLLVGSTRERRDVVGWLLRFAVGMLFILIAFSKFDSDPHGVWYQIFDKIGLGQWFRIATGLIQLTGGILFLFPGTCRVGAVMLAGTMVGAIVVDTVIVGTPLFAMAPAGLFAAIVIVGSRDPSLDSTIATLERRKAARGARS
jgi:uncharacterized membrane protein YphA (DoxX/SURF4 family)